MFDTSLLLALSVLIGLIVLAFAGSRAWDGWLALKTRELDMARRPEDMPGSSREGAARIELSDLKERVRRLEAIANGVDP